MFPLRFFRKRSIDLLLKAVILITVFIFVANITSSYPRGGVTQRALDSIEINVQKRENTVPTINKSYRKENVFLETIQKQKVSDEKLSEVKKDKGMTPIRKSREGEFYKNVVIHFDLKGAPPRVPYFVELLRLIAKGGATGIMLEWEDMFPWKGDLEPFRNTDAYSDEDVTTILEEAKSLQLDIIPLVQTFGHLEWILKYEETRKYRENDAYPQVLCLGNEQGVQLVKEALRQVIEKHRDHGLKFMHIGADEAFEFGVCKESVEWIKKNGQEGGKQLLALAHLKNIAEYVKQVAGQDTTVLAWHDMLKDFDSRIIQKLELGNVIQPVVWDYSENIVTLNDYIFSALAENFPTMWASSAFKGANYPSATKSDVRHYEINNKNWIGTKQRQERKFKNGFNGIIITGWQRYDHLAGLCETLPIGTASMILQMQIALNAPNTNTDVAREAAKKILDCKDFQVQGLNPISNSCGYKGFQTYLIYQSEVPNTFNRINGELEKHHPTLGWANRYNRKYNISQNWYHKEINPMLNSLVLQIDRLENNLRDSMKELFFENTIDEFIYENLGELSEKLHTMKDDMERIGTQRVWPKRVFPIKQK